MYLKPKKQLDEANRAQRTPVSGIGLAQVANFSQAMQN